jgi:tRNA-modifying protein YgfZ
MANHADLAKRPAQPDMSAVMMNQPLPSRALIAVQGPDAQAFLNALLTQAMPPPDGKTAVYAAMLSPQGKVVFDAVVIGHGPELYWLDVAETDAPAALQRLGLFRLNRNVTLTALTDVQAVIAPPDAAAPAGGVRLVDPRRPAGDFAVRVYAPADAQMPQCLTIGDGLEAGVPELSLAIAPDTVFALEALLEELHGVDFHKGCFPGQENVSRMKRRATTRRKLCRIRWDGPGPDRGAPLSADGLDLGTVCLAGAGVGLALLRLDRVLDMRGQLTTPDGVPVQVDAPDWLMWPKMGDDA